MNAMNPSNVLKMIMSLAACYPVLSWFACFALGVLPNHSLSNWLNSSTKNIPVMSTPFWWISSSQIWLLARSRSCVLLIAISNVFLILLESTLLIVCDLLLSEAGHQVQEEGGKVSIKKEDYLSWGVKSLKMRARES